MHAAVVTDIGFGDAGKGTIVDYLARQSHGAVIVRFNGGAQAAHNVHTPDGRHHTFSQFGSGMFVPNTQTFLSRHVLFDPFALQKEADGLECVGVSHPLGRLMVDADALTVTPFQKIGNRLREVLRGEGRHGSVGMGIGETMADMLTFQNLAVYAGDLRNPEVLERKLAGLQELKLSEFRGSLEAIAKRGLLADEIRVLTDPLASRIIARQMYELARQFSLVSLRTLARLSHQRPLIFEGAQGVLIDEWHGFHPYTTWSTTTDRNANALLREIDYQHPVTRYGVVRAYSTRHGPGPFPSEDSGLTAALPDRHNRFGVWQRGFRVGWLDLPLTRYALAVSEATDTLAVTHLDRFAGLPRKQIVSAYLLEEATLTSREREALVLDEKLADEPGTVRVASFRPKAELEDLTYQEMLGDILGRARPVFEETELAGEAYATCVGKLLSTNVGITSYGPTATRKHTRAQFDLTALRMFPRRNAGR